MHYDQKNNGIYILSKNNIESIATENLKEIAFSKLEVVTSFGTTKFLEDL